MTRTAAALAALPTRTGPAPRPPGLAERTADAVTGWLARRTSRRGFLVRAGVVGSALAVDPTGYVLRPGTAYASVCGPGASCSSGWTVFCATVNKGVNACPPGSIAAGWWKMDGASLCGGGSRYIIDCNATCSRCSTAGSRPGICAKSCQSCRCTCGPSSSCDQRRVCCNDFRYGQCNTQVRQVGAVQCRVASCTPPWRFENCSTSPATDNRTVDHNSSELPTRYSRITARYIAIGENGSRLGASVYGEFSVPGGTAQRYQAGRISWSSATGAWEVLGAIGSRYAALGYEGGRLRFPVDRERSAAGGRGRYQEFQRGRISWSAQTGAWETVGAVGSRYAELGWAGGLLGFPLSGETATAGGVYQRFERGRLSWSGATGAHETYGSIGRRYAQLGLERGPLGFPTTGERATATGGRYNAFEHGRIAYSAEHGSLWMGEAIAREYVRRGAEGGELGRPVQDEVAVSGTQLRRVRFERGRLTYDPATGEVIRD